MKKRVLSLFLALTLCLTLLPTAAFAEGETGSFTVDGEPYEGTFADALAESPEEIVLYKNVTISEDEDGTVYSELTINMNGHSIIGNIDVTENLTLENGTITGAVKVDGGTLNMTAPSDAEAAIGSGLNVISGSAYVSGAKIGVKGTLVFGGTDMTITGTGKAVELTAAAEPSSKQLYGSTDVDGDAAEEASFKDGTYQVSGEVAKKLSSKQEGGSVTPEPPATTLTLSPTEKTINAGETATFTAAYTGTDKLKAYIQKNGNDENFDISTPTNNGDGTYTITVEIAKETPAGTYTLYVHEAGNALIQAKAKIHIEGLTPVAEVNSVKYALLTEAFAAARDGDTVTLLADHTTNWSDVEASEYSTLAVIKKTLTLDLNGKTVDYLEVGEVVPDEGGGILESTEGNLTIKDSGLGSVGTVSSLQLKKGKLSIEAGEIGEAGETTSFVCSDENGEVNIHGGKVWVFGCEGGTANIIGGTVYQLSVKKGVVNVSNGTSHGGWNNDSTNYDSATWSVNGGTLNITGGMFGKVRFNYTGGNIDLSGGTFQSISNSNASASAPVMSLLADGYAFYGKDESGEYTVLQSSEETSLTDVKVLEHTKHSFLNGACIACGALTCDKSNNGEEGGCIAHAVWSPWADDPTWGTTHIKTLDELRKKITDGGTYWSEMNPDAANATVTFLSDVTVDKTFLIDKYFAQIFLDLNGHTLSGELQEPIITANFSAGNPIIAIRNGTIENTGTGEAIRLEWGRVTLENVNVTGDMAIAYQYVNGSMYTAPFLGGGSFTRICPAANDVGGTWSEKLKDMLGTGCCFLDSAGSRIDAEQWFGSGGYSKIKELVDVRVKACDHKDENGSYTLFEDATMSYGSLAKRCKICGNLCPHDEITGDQNPACVACGLPIVIKTTNLLGGKDIGPWYYTGLNDAMHEILHVNKGRRPTLELLADTKSDSSYEWLTNDYDGIFIDLAGHTLTLTGDQNKASYWVTIQNTSDTHAEVRGTVNVYHKDNRSKLVILDTDNDLTIEEVKFVGDGTAQFAGGSFGKITVPAGKTLASLLVSGYYFADSNSATDEPAALYDTAGKALTVLTKVTVKPCSHDEAIYVPVDGGAWKCFCGQKTFVASVTKDDTTTLYTDLQEAFKAADGGTVELMANMVDVTVNTEKPFIFDLNGHSIHKLTVNSKITLKDSSEGEGKIVENLIVEAEGLTVGDLLEEGYAFRSCSDNSWYGETLKTVGNARVQQVPITSVTLDALNAKDNTDAPTTMVYGTTGGVKLSASCNILNLTTPDCKWYEVSGSLIPIDNAMGMNYFLPDDLIAGEHTYRVTFISDGYEKSAEITITVEKADLSEAEIEFPYGNEAVFNYLSATGVPTFVVKYNGKEMERDALIITGDTFDGVGPCMLTVKAAENSNYTGSKSADWTVRPLKITASGANVVKTYDGTADLPANASITFKSVDSMYTGVAFGLSKGTDYQLLDARYDSPNAGEEKTVFFTVKLLEQGYVFADGTNETSLALKGSTVKINKADAPNTSSLWLEQHVFNELAKTYEIDLKTLLPGLSVFCEYGEITYGTPRVTFTDTAYQGGDATLTNGVLRLPIASANTSKSEIGTVTIEVNSTNYQTFELTLHVIADDKIVLDQTDVAVSASEITYGQTLADSKLTVTGKMKCPRTGNEIPGTFAWKDGTVIPDAGSYEAEWTFTPDEGYEEYAVATGTVIVKVDKAQLQNVSVMQGLPMPLYYTGEPQRAGVSAVGLGVCGERPTFTYSKTENGEYTSEVPAFTEAGTYTVYYKAEAKNHVTATGSFYVQIKPLPISLLTIEKISKTYDGTASVTLSTEMLTFFSKAARRSDIKLPILALSFSNARFTMKQADGSYVDSPEVGGGKALSFTMTLTSNNYVFEGKSEGTTEVSDVFATDDATCFTITKATAPRATIQSAVTVINGLAKTYEMVLTDNLPKLSSPCEYGSVSYSVKGTYLTDGYKDTVKAEIVEENGQYKLKLTVPAVDYDRESSVGTLDIKVVSDNYQDFTLTIGVKAKNKTVPMPDGEISATDITYGQTLADSKITGKMKDGNKEVTGTFAWKDGTIKPNAGSYEAEWTFTPDASNGGIYANATGKVSVKVNPKDIKGATVTLKSDSFEYDGTRKDPEVASVVLDGETLVYGQYNDYGYHYDMASDVGTYNLVVGGNHNYTGSVSVMWSITPKTVTPTIEVASCSYTGDALTPDVTLTDDIGNTIDPKEYTVSYSNNTNAGTGTVTIKDAAGGNYVLNEASTTFTITKAAAPTLEDITISHKYTVTTGEKTIGSIMPVDAGALSFTKGTESKTGSVTVSSWAVDAVTGKVAYTLSGGTAGDTVILPVTISSTNYADTVVNVVITLTRRDDQAALVITGDTSVIYGEKLILTTTGGSGTGAVTFAVTNGTGEATIEADTGVLTPVKVGTVTVTATKAGDNEYSAAVSAPFTVTITQAASIGEPGYTQITTSGKTLKDAALTTEGSTLNPKDGKLEWVDDEGDVLPGDTRVEANKTYKWRFTPTDTNYTTMTGEIELYHKSSSGGGSGSNSGSYTITVKDAQNGDVTTDRKSASAGTTVTITVKPDSGYVLDDLTVTDSKGNDIKLTGKGGGKYTFTMPSGKATVEASFTPAKSENPFTDVPSGAYYEDAVIWAVNNGITGGTSATTFVPNGFCTRAQAVTFLWRAAGSPAPKSTAMPFTDVPAGSYYYDAVLWAIENGVTKGTSDTTFSPNANCSRGQIVTFLWRSQMSPDAAAANPFTDVVADAYYTSAVLWAVERNITGGTSATTFSPSANCTRAQIVTFIYRCMK